MDQQTSEAVTSKDSNYSAFQEAIFIPAMHGFWRLLGEGQTLLALDINAVMLSWCDDTDAKKKAMEDMQKEIETLKRSKATSASVRELKDKINDK